jgi:hypothetical protein
MHGETVPFGRINVFVIYTASTSSVVHHNPDDLNLEDVNNYKEIPLSQVLYDGQQRPLVQQLLPLNVRRDPMHGKPGHPHPGSVN